MLLTFYIVNQLYLCTWSNGLLLEKPYASAAMPPISAQVPSQRPLASSVISVMSVS